MNVLVVEDVAVAREILRAVAYSAIEGSVVFTAANIEEGLALPAMLRHPDLVLLDLGLPACRGIDALVKIKAAFPQAKTIVVSADETLAAEALRAGADGFVAKAHVPADVFAAIRAVLDGRRFQSALAGNRR